MGTTTCCRCHICGQKITYNYNDTSPLINHSRNKHNDEYDVVHYECDTSHLYGPSGDVNKSNTKKFKTTVETWKTGPAPQRCPYCFKTDVPLIRKQRNKIARTSLGALFLLGCWPLCFLPFILSGSDKLNLFCKHCGNLIATYDRRNGCICQENNNNKKLTEIPSKVC